MTEVGLAAVVLAARRLARLPVQEGQAKPPPSVRSQVPLLAADFVRQLLPVLAASESLAHTSPEEQIGQAAFCD